MFIKPILRLSNRFVGTDRDFARRVRALTGFTPCNLEVFRLAFRHSSAQPESKSNNERLEYLGDAVLDTVISNYLFKKYPKRGEGFLTETRAKIVSRKKLGEIGHTLGLEDYSSGQVRSRIDGLIDIYIKSKYVGLANSIIASFIVSFATLTLIVLTSRELILYQTISLGMIITFVAMSKKIFKAFSRLLNANLSLQEHRVILKRVFAFNETKETTVAPNANLIRRFDFHQLSVHDIEFAYQEEEPVLNKISLRINKGDRIWIKGKNGTGKSTFCKIMTGLYQPDNGSIRINNIDTTLYHPKALTKTIALISSKDMIFNDTLLFNITFGKKVDLKELIEYAKMVNLYDFINSKAEKFDYVIHENGNNLSTGQRRKILILRALILDAEVIILDEVFNGIDQSSKQRIEQLIDLIEDKTFIIISHTPVQGIRIDQKYILEDGKFIHQDTSGI